MIKSPRTTKITKVVSTTKRVSLVGLTYTSRVHLIITKFSKSYYSVPQSGFTIS